MAIHTPQRISWPTSQVSSSMRSSTSPTACSDSSDERLGHRGVDQVGAQLALGPVDHDAPDGAGGGVDERATDDAQREESSTSVEVGESASRPAATLPSDEAIAPTSASARHTTVSGRRTRRQSTGCAVRGEPGTGVVASAEREAAEVCAVRSVAVTVLPR